MAEMTQERLRELFDYNPETGIFIRRRTGNNPARMITRGYLAIFFDGTSQRVARMAWLYVYGVLAPDLDIDHINGKRSDNRIENLRAVPRRDNNLNMSLPKNNKSGTMGVHWNKAANRWIAIIAVDHKRYHLGSFKSKDEAVAARKAAEVRFGFHPGHGKSNGPLIDLSPQMLRMLEDINNGFGSHGTAANPSEHRGRNLTVTALLRRGLIDHATNLTEAGKQTLDIHQPKPE